MHLTSPRQLHHGGAVVIWDQVGLHSAVIRAETLGIMFWACLQPHHQNALCISNQYVLQTTWALRDIEQRLKDTQLVASGLKKALQGSDQKLHSMRQRVLVMEGR